MSVALARQLTPASVTQSIPDDAADWFRTHFDWTRGAVWVACERWRVDAATVVTWAEKVRAGGARAGLSTKERTWMVVQLSDPEQQPTAAEMAMARATYAAVQTTAVREEARRVTMTTAVAHTYESREAQCDYCGVAFTARKYSSGWTRYCSASCGGKARHASSPKPSDTAAPAPAPVSAPKASSTLAPMSMAGPGDRLSLLTALIDRLPLSGTWTSAQRDRWLRAFTATLDLEVTMQDSADDGATTPVRAEA